MRDIAGGTETARRPSGLIKAGSDYKFAVHSSTRAQDEEEGVGETAKMAKTTANANSKQRRQCNTQRRRTP